MRNYENDNCLFCPTDSYLYGQVEKEDVENTLSYLRTRYPEHIWRADEHKYAFVALPELQNFGGCKFKNPNVLWSNRVWITFAPEYSSCIVNEDGDVIINPGVYNLYNYEFETGLQF